MTRIASVDMHTLREDAPERTFDPKPFEVGSTVTVDGRTFAIQSHGPEAASRWGIDTNGTWELLKIPSKRRAASIITTELPGVSRGDWAQQALARAEVIRGGVAVHGSQPWDRIIHASRHCPQATGRAVDEDFGLNRAALRQMHETLAGDDATWNPGHAPVESVCPCVADAAEQTRPRPHT